MGTSEGRKEISNMPESVLLFQRNQAVVSMPELETMRKTIENNPWHNHQDTYSHTQVVLSNLDEILNNASKLITQLLDEKISKLSRRESLWYATLLHDIGKPDAIVRDGDQTSFPNHEEKSAKIAQEILERIGIDIEDCDEIVSIIKSHGVLHNMLREESLPEKYRQFCIDNPSSLELTLLSFADTFGSYLEETDPVEYKRRIDFYSEAIGNWGNIK